MVLSREKITIELARSSMTIGELAIMSNLSRSAVDSALNEKDIRPKSAGKIARALNVDVIKLEREQEKNISRAQTIDKAEE